MIQHITRADREEGCTARLRHDVKQFNTTWWRLWQDPHVVDGYISILCHVQKRSGVSIPRIHLINMKSQVCSYLSGDVRHAREVIDPLPRRQLSQPTHKPTKQGGKCHSLYTHCACEMCLSPSTPCTWASLAAFRRASHPFKLLLLDHAILAVTAICRSLWCFRHYHTRIT